MNYFITNRQDVLTSSIEIAQVQRLRIFDALHQDAAIITLDYNHDHELVERKLNVHGRVINLYQFFQQLDYNHSVANDHETVDQVFKQFGGQVKNDCVYKNDKKRVQVVYNRDRLYSLNYYDQFGFLDRSDYYDCGCLSYTDFFEDRGRKVVRQYFDNDGQPVIECFYRGGKGNYPVLTLIKLTYRHHAYYFDTQDELRAFFLDELVQRDPEATFISDRSDATLKAFQLMKHSAHKYQVFHSAFTVDGQLNSKLFDVYKPLPEMLKAGELQGIISSTKQEAVDAGQRFNTEHSYAIPVTYLSDELLNKKIPFENRIPYQLIAVSRLSEVKRLDHLINTVILLHDKFPKIDLKIYGYDENIDNYATSTSLKKIVKDHQAESYVHFCGYLDNLDDVYETADIEVLTSSFEGFAMALLEASGHACPVVSYDINYGPSEIIEEGKNGRLVPAGDLHSLYKTLFELLSDRSKLRYYSSNRQQVAQKYSFDNVKKQWQNFLANENLLAKNK